MAASPSVPARHWSRRRRLRVVAILTLAILAASGFALYPIVAVESQERAIRRWLRAGRTDQAAQGVEQWLKASPHSAAAHYYKARVAWLQQDLPTVDLELSRARELGYAQASLERLRGLLLARGTQTSEAERLLRPALEDAHGNDPEVAEALTRIYLGTFRLGEAAQILDRWMQESPRDARPYMLRAEIDVSNREGPEILLERYRSALARDPTLEKAHLGLAEQLRFKGAYAEAAAEYAVYLARHPDDAVACAWAAHNAMEMDNLAEATRLFNHALARVPNDPEVLAVGAALELRQGHLEEALGYFTQAVKAAPFDHRLRYRRVLLLSRLGRKAEASAELAMVDRLKKDLAQFAQLRKELLRNPTDPRLRSEAATWLMDHGHEEEGLEWANLVLRSDPAHPAMNRLLADYHRKKGHVGLANFHEAHLTNSAPQAGSTP
jgi:tetratricopeptide (TPR) repeat protein